MYITHPVNYIENININIVLHINSYCFTCMPSNLVLSTVRVQGRILLHVVNAGLLWKVACCALAIGFAPVVPLDLLRQRNSRSTVVGPSQVVSNTTYAVHGLKMMRIY